MRLNAHWMRSTVAGFALLGSAAGMTAQADAAAGYPAELNGVYNSVNGSGDRALVEAVPDNNYEQLTVIVNDAEINVARAPGAQQFRADNNGCSALVTPFTNAQGIQALNIQTAGSCAGYNTNFYRFPGPG